MQNNKAYTLKKQTVENLLNNGKDRSCCVRFWASFVSLRNVVLFTIIILVLVSSFGILVTNAVTMYDVADRFVKELRAQITAGIEGKLELMLANPQNEVLQMADWYHSGVINGLDDENLHKLAYGGISRRPEYASYFFASAEENSLQGYHRPSATNGLWLADLPPNNKTIFELKYYSLDENGNANFSDIKAAQTNFMVEKRAYYKAVLNHPGKEVVFGEPYIGGQPYSVLFPCTSPIYDLSVSPKKLVGAAVINYASYTLRDFFHSMDFGKGGYAYIMTDDGRLLATSDKRIPGWITVNGVVGFLNATNTTEWNGYIAQSAAYILQNVDKSQNSTTFKVKINNDGTTVQHQVIRLPGININLVVIVAYNDFNGNYIQNVVISVAISFGVMVLSLVVGLTVSICSTYRLHKLSQLMSEAADMNLDAISLSTKDLAWLKEIRKMEVSFKWLIKNLKEYKTFLPANLFNQGGGSDDDVDETQRLLEPGASPHSSARRINKVAPSAGSNSENGSKVGFSRFELGLQQQEVTVMHIKFENFSSLAAKLSLQELIEIHTTFINKIHDIIKTKRGSIERFVGNVVTCTWNSAFPCSNHAVNSCISAIDLRNAIESLNAGAAQHSRIELSIGISSGIAACGNMGCEAIRTFTTIGTVTKRCNMLMTLCPIYGTKILIDGSTMSKVQNHFYTVPINTIHFVKFNKDITSKTELMQDKESFDLYELIRPKKKKQGDEWMYEMKDNEEERCWNELHDAYTFKKKGMFESAREKFLLFQKLHPEEASHVQLSTIGATLYNYYIEEWKT